MEAIAFELELERGYSSGSAHLALETALNGEWAKHFFPNLFTRPFTSYQNDFWNWAIDLERDAKPRPRIECEPRGVGKSTHARTLTAFLLAKKIKSYVLYICATDHQAQKHFNAIKAMLESEKLLKAYPHLNPQTQKHRQNVAKSWSSERLVTKEGQVVEFISLLSNARGFTTEAGKRPDMFVLDDIDDSKDSPYLVNKKLDILKYAIIPARADHTLVLFAQNLIHRDSICQKIRDQRADILSDRIFVGPYPLMKCYEAVKEDIEGETTGAKRWRIISGEAFDEAVPLETCEQLLNEMGRDAFERECQQDVHRVGDDKDFREWNEIHHIITFSEFKAFFEKYSIPIWNHERDAPQIPANWNVGLGLDWGTTVGHPSVITAIARPNQSAPLNDCFFVFMEMCLPKYPLASHEDIPLVSAGRVAEALQDGLKEWNVARSQIKMQLMSHEASAALNTMRVDLQDHLKTFFSKWKAQKGSGVAQIQNLLEINKTKPHPFRSQPVSITNSGNGSDQTDSNKAGSNTEIVQSLFGQSPTGQPAIGESIMGRPRIFFIVPDEQGKLIADGSGRLFVAQPIDRKGFARARYEMPIYSQHNSGQHKTDDDFVDAFRGIMNRFGVSSQPLTDEEEFIKMLEEEKPYLLPEVIAAEPEPDRRSQRYASLIQEQKKFHDAKSIQYEKGDPFAEMYDQQGLEDDLSWMEEEDTSWVYD